MAQALVRARSGPHIGEPGNPLRGHIEAIRKDGLPWGRLECLPEFVIIKVPGVDPADVVAHERTWDIGLAFEVLSSNAATDTHRIRASGSRVNAGTGEGKITRAMVENYLTRWGATNITVADNAVEFDTRIADAIQSDGFWISAEAKSGLVITELSYNRSQGRHRTLINWAFKEWPTDPDEREKMIDGLVRFIQDNATVVALDRENSQVTVDIYRDTVREEFLESVRMRAERIMVRRKRYRVPESAIVAAEAAGGVLEVTPAQYMAGIIDGLTE